MIKTEIIPVIHVVDYKQASTNIDVCKEAGIKKVFLISHRSANEELIGIVKGLKFLNPDMWIGINLLGVPTIEALTMPELDGVDGIWADVSITPEMAEKRTFKGVFFGGLAFKYQKQPTDLEAACKEAILATDVATTSGSGTGKEPTDTKITTIREYLGEHPMAIASGVNAENIKRYSGVVNYLLVASSITDKKEFIILEKLAELINNL